MIRGFSYDFKYEFINDFPLVVSIFCPHKEFVSQIDEPTSAY